MKVLYFCVSALVVLSIEGCQFFNQAYKDAQSIVNERREYEQKLESKGYVLTTNDIGFERSRSGSICGTKNFYKSNDGKVADYLNTAARLLSERDPGTEFSSYAQCLNRSSTPIQKQPKYKSLNGWGNNLQNPTWGMANTPFARLTAKTYDDGVSSIRRSVTGAELPPARLLVTEVLLKAEKKTRTKNRFNMIFLLDALYISHDQGQQIPVEACDNCQEIRCCSSGNKKVLDPSVSHPACLPITVSENDEFYSQAGVGCLSMVRSEFSSSPTTVETGEVRNKVTSYIDHTLIYGSSDSESRKIRTFKGGKLNLGSNNSLPVDLTGRYTSISGRSIAVPLSAIWPILHARHHNHLAEGLAKINPKWNDEKLFLEARRLNIAIFDRIINHDAFFKAFGVKLDGTYKPEARSKTSHEFNTIVYRFLHVNVNPNMYFVDKEYNVQKVPISDTFGRIDLVEKNLDDAIRGAMAAEMVFGSYTDEMYNLFAKNINGIGLDIISLDILRSRDHGVASYLQARKDLGFKADYETFEDLIEIFPQSYIDLLKKVYADVRDIDLYVGGALESFLVFDHLFIGETFQKILDIHFVNNIESDAYFYTHKTSPHPFTDAQIAAIETIGFNNIICVNSGLEKTTEDWSKLPDDTINPFIPCSNFKPIDLSAWKGI